MKQKITLNSLLLVGALSLGWVSLARADDSVVAAPAAASAADSAVSNPGLLGQKYATLSYSYINLDGTSVHADNYTFELNQPLAFGLDGVFAYDYGQTGLVAGSRLTTQTLSAGLRAFSSSYNWGKPYVEAGVGYAWSRFGGMDDNSFGWAVAAGTEFQVGAQATVTPYVQYADAPELTDEGSWNFGVKGSYWIDASWAVTAGFQLDDDQNTAFTVGTNFRF